jgi:ClpP class serine protease
LGAERDARAGRGIAYPTPNGVKTPRRASYTRTGFVAIHKGAWGSEVEEPSPRESAFREEGSVAIVDICGPLFQRADPWGFFDSYDAIAARAAAAFACATARKVMLSIDSPGGDAAGCFELSRELRKMAVESGKPLAVSVKGMAASAAWAIATAATAGIWAPPTSSVGSIGVYEAILDVTEQDRMLGVKVSFRASGRRKLDGNPHVPVTPEAEESLQAKVDLLAGLFFDLVEEHTGIAAAEIAALEGELLLAGQALAKGLIAGLKTERQLLEALENPQMTTPVQPPKRAQAKANDKEWEALRTLAESDDEEHRKMAKKLLAKMMGGEGDGDGKEPDGDEAARKAEADDKEKKDKEEADAKAKALSANAMAMAQELQQLKADNARRDAQAAADKEAAERAGLLTKRPDFSDAQRKTLASVPVAALREAVETWPRASADAGAAAAAMTAGVSGGERQDAEVGLTPEQSAIIARLDGNGAGPRAVVIRGTETSVPIYDRETALARIAEKAAAQGKV